MRGWFARVCVEIELDKPLVATYKMRGEEGQIQYEGLYDLCFLSGKYGHKETACPRSTSKPTEMADGEEGHGEDSRGSDQAANAQSKNGLGPWMVAQRQRRRQARRSKGISGNQEQVVGEVGMDRSRQRKDSISNKVNGQQPNTGSRFDTLADRDEMETDRVEDGIKSNPETLAADREGAEVVMEGVETADAGGERVNISVSHLGLAEGLRPLAGLKTNLRVQAQEHNGGLKKGSGRVMRDISNKLDVRPLISKVARPTQSSSGAQQAGFIRILKRSGEAWRNESGFGPPPKSPSIHEGSSKKVQTEGSGLVRPPDPPDEVINVPDGSNPRSPPRLSGKGEWRAAAQSGGGNRSRRGCCDGRACC